MKSGYTREKILIWAKTYPELSSKYLETVCTAGMLPSGKPLRLYPIPYRYLAGEKEQFTTFLWGRKQRKDQQTCGSEPHTG